LTRAALFGPAYRLGQALRPWLPRAVRTKLLAARAPGERPRATRARKMLLLEGCVQPSVAPGINAAAARVLDRLGVQLLSAPAAGCCGAVRFHLDDQRGALAQMRRNIDAWWPYLDDCEALVITASGCGVTVKDYGHLLAHDSAYAAKAATVAALARDLAEVVDALAAPLPVALHIPCTPQHGQRITGKIEPLLRQAGITLTACADSHLCCGSAGTYSVLQPLLAGALRERKLASLEAGAPALIASANIGCIAHLQGGTATPVRHWSELLDDALA